MAVRERHRRRPAPDEPPLEDLRLRDFTLADWRAILARAVKRFVDDNAMMLASALAYSAFFAIPAALLVAVGLFTLIAGPGTITSLMHHFHHVMPGQATSLLGSSLRRLDAHPAQSIAITAIGFVLALWSTTGAMNAYMTAINIAYERKDRRSFVRKRIVALKLVAIMCAAFALVAVFLMFGPQVEKLVASHADGAAGVVSWLWWVAQWPILLAGLLAAFAALLHLGPDIEEPRWELMTPGSIVTTFLWLATSALFAVYTAMFGSYNKTWGALSAVIVMLTWLWLTGMALLLGAEINAETERCRRERVAQSRYRTDPSRA
jgi:membrane protein